MNKITIFNTWVSSENTGDKIIMEACEKNINKLFSKSIFVEIPTHTKMTFYSHKVMTGSNFGIVCGSNLLKPEMFFKKLWKINLLDSIFMRDAVLMGVGWTSYSKKTSIYSKILWKRVLSQEYLHSVRDDYTKNKLAEIGITNVINTACPTMWDLTAEHCEQIPISKATDVVMTITNYNRDIMKDNELINILSNNYEIVYLWPQNYEDIIYLKEDLDLPLNSVIIEPNLNAFNRLLNTKNLDYVGTRLHAGIRALQLKRRSIIIGIDNRAIEKSKFGLKVINRNELEKLEPLINSNFPTKIDLPFDNIEKWKQQFSNEKIEFKEKNTVFKMLDKLKKVAKSLIIN